MYEILPWRFRTVFLLPKIRGRQLGDGMGGGRNGCFWGAPILHFWWKMLYFSGFGQKSGRPKNGRSHHHPSHPQLTPSEKTRKSGWLEVDQELDNGRPTFDTNISVLKLQGSFLQSSSGNKESPDSRESFQGSRLNPFFESHFESGG